MSCPGEFGAMVGYCGHLGKLCMDGHLRRYEVTPVQAQVICFLMGQGESRKVTLRDLERELRLKAPTVNGVVDRMEEKGLLTRTTSRSDARCRVLRLTEKGRQTAERFGEAVHRVEQIYLASLTAEEQELLRGMLTRLIEHLETEVKEL